MAFPDSPPLPAVGDEHQVPLRIDPRQVTAAEFDKARKGYDRIQVRAYLTVVGRELERLSRRELELSADLQALKAQLEGTRTIDPDQLTQLLGDEAARVLNAAREAAAARLSAADTTAAATIHEAEAVAMTRRDEAAADAARMRADADQYARDTRRSAEIEAASIRAEAETVAAALRSRGETDARDEVAAAQAHGEQLVADAERVRDRVLRDYSRRRKALRAQVEQLRAAHDRMLEAHRVARASLDDAEHELETALPAARAAAQAAAAAVEAEPDASLEQLAAEIEMARLVALPVVLDEPVSDDADDAYVTGEHDVAAMIDGAGSGRTDVALAVAVTAEPDIAAAPGVARADAVGAEPAHGSAATVPEVEAAALAAVAAESADAAEPGTVESGTVESDAVESEVAEPPADAADRPAAGGETEAAPATGDGIVIDLRDGALSDEAVDSLFERIRSARTAEATETARPHDVDDPYAVAHIAGLSARTSEADPATVAEAGSVMAAVDAAPLPASASEYESSSLGEPETLLARRDSVLDVFEVELTRLLKRRLSDEQNEVQDRIRRIKAKRSEKEGVLPDTPEHLSRYTEAVREQVAAVARAAAEFFGSAVDPGDHSALSVQLLAGSLVQPLRDQIERVLADTPVDDERIERVRSIYREAKSPRADLVARELTMAVFNAAALRSFPPETPVVWVVDPQRGCSPDCFDNSLAVNVRAGEPFPTGARCPPLHQRCRCLVAPAR